jgi:ADP-heptose:LPS heptosyltransferase
MSRHVLAVRLDSAGDVLLTGPAIRALGTGAETLTLLCGPRGRAAGDLLPDVDRVIEWCAPWIDATPPPVRDADVPGLIARIAALGITDAVIFTSFHQSALPTALILRQAGVRTISAISDDYPGSLLDLRYRVPEEIPEPERALSLAIAAGYGPPPGDDGRLRLRAPLPAVTGLLGRVRPGYVVVHPGTSVPARAWPPERCAEAVVALARSGHDVVVTGSPDERSLSARVAGEHAVDLGARTTLAELAAVLAGAAVVVVGNTGPAHLAAAVGTPVVSLFAPTVPASAWAPYGVPSVLLGDQDAACRGTRATACPVPGHPCLRSVTAAQVVAAVERLVS